MSLPPHAEPWWLVTRVTGVAATIAVGAAVVLGAALSRRGPRTRARLAWHRRVTWAGLGLIGLHIAAALLDRHHVPSYALVAPFLSPVRRVAAGTGVLAVWGFVIVALTAVWRTRLKRVWRRVHYLAYPVSALVVAHSLMGTDSDLVWMSGFSIICPLVIWWGRPSARARLTSARPVGPATSPETTVSIAPSMKPTEGGWRLDKVGA